MAVGQEVKTETLLPVIIRNLPSTYSELAAHLRYDDEVTYEALKKKMRAHYLGCIKRADLEKGDALIGVFHGKCFECGERGHSQNFCPNLSGGVAGGGRGTGGGRGKGGADKGRRGGGRGGGGRGGGQGKEPKKPGPFKGKCMACQTPGHKAADCPLVRKAKEQANHGLMAEETDEDWALAVGNLGDRGPGGSDRSSWVVDSGCTVHVTASPELLSNVEAHKGEITVGDGRRLPTVARGEIKGRVRREDGVFINVTWA